MNACGVAVLCAEIAASFLSSSAAASTQPAALLLNNPNPPILGVGNPSFGAGLLGSSLSLLSLEDEAACWLCFAVPLPQLLLHQCSSCSFLQHPAPITPSHTRCSPPGKCQRNLGFLLKEMLRGRGSLVWVRAAAGLCPHHEQAAGTPPGVCFPCNGCSASILFWLCLGHAQVPLGPAGCP